MQDLSELQSRIDQFPSELKASSSREWPNYVIDTFNFHALRVSLPDFFTRYHDSLLESGPLAASAEFKPSNDSIGRFFITIWENDNPKQLYKALSDELKRTKDSVLSKHVSKNFFTVWTEPRSFGNHEYFREEGLGPRSVLINYAHGFVASGRVYEIVISFEPQYREAITAILPRILSSFRTTKNS